MWSHGRLHWRSELQQRFFLAGRFKESITGWEPVSIVHYKYHGAHPKVFEYTSPCKLGFHLPWKQQQNHVSSIKRPSSKIFEEILCNSARGVSEVLNLNKPGISATQLFNIIQKAYIKNSLNCCSIQPDPNIHEARTSMGLIKGHAYSITKVASVHLVSGEKVRMIRVRNSVQLDAIKISLSHNYVIVVKVLLSYSWMRITDFILIPICRLMAWNCTVNIHRKINVTICLKYWTGAP